jgi:hypothetical protein
MTTPIVREQDITAFLAAGAFLHIGSLAGYLAEVLDLRVERVVEEESAESITTVRMYPETYPPTNPNKQTVVLTKRQILFRSNLRTRDIDPFLADQMALAEGCLALVEYLEALGHVGVVRIIELVYYKVRSVPVPGGRPVMLAGLPLLKVRLEPGDTTIVCQMNSADGFTVWQTLPNGTRRTVRVVSWRDVIDCLTGWCDFEIV